MISNNLLDLTAELDAVLHGEDTIFNGVVIDSRAVCGGELFFALNGREDGHQFVEAAARAGAAAAVVSHAVDIDFPQVIVEDTEIALQQLARWWRSQLRQTRFFAVTGSNGKTTTKQMLSQLLEAVGTTQATQGNLNNHLGVPLTLLSISPSTQYAVIELGASAVGEIDMLCRIVEPHYAIALNAGGAHLEGFGSESALRRAKGEIFAASPANAVCVYWLEQPEIEQWKQQIGSRRSVSFAFEHAAADVIVDAANVCVDKECADLSLGLLGAHNRLNAAAAIAAVVPDFMSLSTAVKTLADVKPVPGRLQFLLQGPVTIVNDAYNANPQSMRGAIDVLKGLHGLRVLMMGDMAELGENALDEHIEVIEYALAEVDQVFYSGCWSAALSKKFKEKLNIVDGLDDSLEQLEAISTPKSVLYKASRSAGLDNWAKRLAEHYEGYRNVE